MLEFIREKLKGTFAIIIVGFFCAVFALWGVESLFSRNAAKQAVVTVNGTDITEAEVANAIQVMRQRYMQMLGGQVDESFLNDKMLRQPALESLISRQLLGDHTKEMKMTVGATTVDREIVRDPTFSRDGKTFDPGYYKERLRAARISAVAYQDQLREQLVLQHLQQGISGTAFITGRQVADIARLEAQKRSVDYVRFPLQDTMKAITPADAEVEKYYQEHPEEFLTEEKVVVEYLELDKQGMLDTVPLDEAEVRAKFDEEAAAFKSSSERRAAHILIEPQKDGSEKALLDTISQKLAKGEDFAALAKKYSRDEGSAGQGGDVGYTTGETFVPEFEAALAALQKPGDVSPPVKTEFGYHIIKLLEVRQTAMPTYEERKGDIEKQLRQAKVVALFGEKLDLLSEATYSAGDLAGPAAELGLAVKKTAAFGRRGGAGIAGQQKVIDAAFSAELLDSGKNSQVIELGADRAIVLRVASHDLPKPRELAEVRADIVARLQREQASAVLKQKLETLEEKLKSGTALADIAKQEGLKLQQLAGKTRRDAGAEAEMVQAVFSLPQPGAGAVVADSMPLGNGDWVLLQLTAVESAQPAPASEEYRQVEQRLAAAAGNSDFGLYEQGLRAAATIKRRAAEPEPVDDKP